MLLFEHSSSGHGAMYESTDSPGDHGIPGVRQRVRDASQPLSCHRGHGQLHHGRQQHNQHHTGRMPGIGPNRQHYNTLGNFFHLPTVLL